MLKLLHSHLSLSVTALVVLVLILLRLLVREPTLRADLRGSIQYLLASLVVRGASVVFEGLPAAWDRGLALGWMLLLAFGVVRGSVSLALWIVRLRTGQPTPRILRDVLDFTLYVIAAVTLVKWQLEIDLTGLLATSAILSVVLGFALQDTLGNLFAGLALQVERPFRVGDYVRIGVHEGQVVQLAWRATRIRTFKLEEITLPNSVLSKEAVTNFSEDSQALGRDIFFEVSYDAPPARVHDLALDIATGISLAKKDPAPYCYLVDYGERGMRYRMRMFAPGYETLFDIEHQFREQLWYRLQREGYAIGRPQREVHGLGAGPLQVDSAGQGERRSGAYSWAGSRVRREEIEALLSEVPILQPLSQEERTDLARAIRPRFYGPGERVVRQGEPGDTFYLIAAGSLVICLGDPSVEIRRLGRGDHFGEVALLTGSPRVATVRTVTEALLYELDRAAFARLLERDSERQKVLSKRVAERQAELTERARNLGTIPPRHASPEPADVFRKLKDMLGL